MTDLLAQSVSEHLPFKEGVLGSSPRGVTITLVALIKPNECLGERIGSIPNFSISV